MSTYIMLNQWTATGIEHVTKTPERLDKARKMAVEMGCEIKAFYVLMGHKYDSAVIVEAPDDAAMAKLALGIAMRGNVRTQTLRAFTENEFEELLKAL